jgi:transcriptional regulator with XRE-family HTH domain
MIMGDRLRALREQKGLSQGDIAERTGLMCSYISRVENGHTVPAVETLQKFARALEVPIYQLFYDGEEPPGLPVSHNPKVSKDKAWGARGKDAFMLRNFPRLLGRIDADDRKLLFAMAQKMAGAP